MTDHVINNIRKNDVKQSKGYLQLNSKSNFLNLEPVQETARWKMQPANSSLAAELLTKENGSVLGCDDNSTLLQNE